MTSIKNRYLYSLLSVIFLVTGIFFEKRVVAAPDTTLYLSPTSQTVNIGDDFNVEARIDPGTNAVTAVELHFTFDETKLRLDSITESPAFSDILTPASIDNSSGTASIILGVGTGGTSVTGDELVATLGFHALDGITDSTVDYTSSSIAAAEGESGNVVTTRNSATVMVLEGDTTAPTITSIFSDKADDSYTVGEVIDIDVTFSEPVTSTGDVTVTLETGTTDRTCIFSVSNATTGTCDYIVQAGDTSSDLNVASVSGTIEDQSSNEMTDFTPITNLADNKNLVIVDPITVEIEENDTSEVSEEFSDSDAKLEIYYTSKEDEDEKREVSEESITRVTSQSVRFGGDAEAIAGGEVRVVDVRNNDEELFDEDVKNDGTWKRNFDFGEDGEYTVRLRFYDKNGNKVSSSKRYKFRIDTERPEFTDFPERLRRQPRDLVHWIAEDNSKIEKYRYTFNGRTKETELNHFYLPPDIGPGEYEISVRAYDDYGNKTEAKSIIELVLPQEEPVAPEEQPELQGERQETGGDDAQEKDKAKSDEMKKTREVTEPSSLEEVPSSSVYDTPSFNPSGKTSIDEDVEYDTCQRKWWNPFTWWC